MKRSTAVLGSITVSGWKAEGICLMDIKSGEERGEIKATLYRPQSSVCLHSTLLDFFEVIN